MASILLSLKNKKRKDNTYSIVIRIRHGGKFFDILTFENVPESKFDRNKDRVVGNATLQHHLEELKEKYAKRLRAFTGENLNRQFSLEKLKESVLQKSVDEITVEEFWQENIDQLLKSGRVGSVRIYKNTHSIFSNFIDLMCSFRTIGVKHLQKIEKELRMRGNKYN